MNSSILAPSLTNPTPVLVGPKVGDILLSTWGYEASIATWAKVVGVTGKSVKIAYIGAIEKHTGPMEWTSLPDVNSVGKKVVTKRFTPAGSSYKVKDSSFSNFYPWKGTEPISCYNYH